MTPVSQERLNDAAGRTFSRAIAAANASPSSYTVGGKQYIVVGGDGNTHIDFRRGDSIIAFTLD